MKVTTILWIIIFILGVINWLDFLDIKHFPNEDFKDNIYALFLFFVFWLRMEELVKKNDN